MSKVTRENIKDFGNPKKSERQKRIDTMMAWVGMTAVEDLEPEDRQRFLDAVGETKKEAKESEIRNPNEPFLSNYDYHGNYLDKVRERLKKLKKLNKSVDSKIKESKASIWNRETRLNKLEDIMKDPFAPIREKEYVIGIGDAESNGKPVSRIQRLLLSKGYSPLRVDGIFGEETASRVKEFQKDSGLIEDGIVGMNTINALSPQKSEVPAAELNEGENAQELIYEGVNIAPLAADIGISPLFLEAILKVESLGNPESIRFEPHLFNRAMMRKGRKDRVPFTPAPGRVYSTIPSETNKNAFFRAFEIDKKAAIKAASWGSGQVMGGRLLEIEPDPDKAVDLFFNSPQIVSYNLMIAWFKRNPEAIKAANDLDFKTFAKLYNGPLYWQGKYDQRIRSAYEKAARRSPQFL